jgi:hypothetical protein
MHAVGFNLPNLLRLSPNLSRGRDDVPSQDNAEFWRSARTRIASLYTYLYCVCAAQPIHCPLFYRQSARTQAVTVTPLRQLTRCIICPVMALESWLARKTRQRQFSSLALISISDGRASGVGPIARADCARLTVRRSHLRWHVGAPVEGERADGPVIHVVRWSRGGLQR